MKTTHILLLATACLVASHLGLAQTVTISGRLPKGVTEVRYGKPQPADGRVFAGSYETLPTAKGQPTFTLQFAAARPAASFVNLFPLEEAVDLLLVPGGRYEIRLGKDGPTVRGTDALGHRYHQALQARASRRREVRSLVADTTQWGPVVVQALQQGEPRWRVFDSLHQKRAISAGFHQLATAQWRTYAYLVGAEVLAGKVFLARDEAELVVFAKQRAGEIQALLAEMTPRAGDFLDFTEGYLLLKQCMELANMLQADFSPQKMQELEQAERAYSYHYQFASTVYQGQTLEYFRAVYLTEAALQQQFEAELIDLLAKFEQDYPQSPYLPKLRQDLAPVVAYHAKIKSGQTANATFIDCKDCTLETVLKPFGDQKVLIDLWATWCGPCKEEFAHKTQLAKLLQEKGVAMLYISIDRPEAQAKWKQMINYYDLAGTHVLAGQQLAGELRQKFGENGGLAIPRYIIANGQGQILNKAAARPSELDQLAKELE
jgi:thiol-disulfide isomerase/thioredoxin